MDSIIGRYVVTVKWDDYKSGRMQYAKKDVELHEDNEPDIDGTVDWLQAQFDAFLAAYDSGNQGHEVDLTDLDMEEDDLDHGDASR